MYWWNGYCCILVSIFILNAFFFFFFLFLHFIRFRLSLVWYVICDYWMTSQKRRKNKLLGAVRSFYRLVHFYRNVGFSICICICLNMNIVAAEKSKLRLSDESINWCKVLKFVVVVFLTDNIHNLYFLKDKIIRFTQHIVPTRIYFSQ